MGGDEFIASCYFMLLNSFIIMLFQVNRWRYNGDLFNFNEAVDYINSQIELGNAVVIGVDAMDAGGTDDMGTDHYITIVGRSSEDGDGYFIYIENATRNESRATNFDNNRIYPETGTSGLRGQSVRNGGTTYETTRVQENQ